MSERPVSYSLGKYRLIAELGHGGMADVYLAVVEGLGGFNRLLVIKVLRNTEDPDFLSMFLDEARLTARLQHPNVVQTYEIGHEDERYFLAMEFLNGTTFQRLRKAAVTRGGGLSLPVAVHLVSNILAGLHHAHELKDYSGAPLNVVHRDLSPHNVMVSFDGECKILDFGIAKVMDASRETRAGIFKGKIAYSSPEQIRGLKLDRRSDLFSVGIMLWEAIAGAPLWGTLNTAAIGLRLMEGAIPTLLSVKPDAPQALVDICARALAPAPEDRYATAADFNAELEAFAQTLGPQISRRDVADLVGTLFRAERERIQTIIERQLSTVLKSAPVEAPGVRLPSLLGPSGTPSSNPIPGSEVRREVTPNASRIESRPPPPPPPSPPSADRPAEPPLEVSDFQTVYQSEKRSGRRPIAPLLAGALAVVLAGVLVAWLWPSERVPPPTPPPSPLTIALASPSATKPSPPPEVQLHVVVSPDGAQVSLDGKVMGQSPFIGSFPRDERWHQLGISAKGFRAVSKEVRFSQDAHLELALVAEPAKVEKPEELVRVEKAEKAAKAEKAKTSKPALSARAVVAPPPASPKSPPPTVSKKAEMGDHLLTAPRQKSKHQIDREDPWTQQ
jgi:serine/threonine-protein kinase